VAARKAFREVLATYDVLETFELLPEAEQEKFSSWIENASSDESRWRRIEAFVLALRVGPLQPAKPVGPSESVG
jgi:uncharacterized protein YdeI (YjbR/CyaY-like superfamily)